MTIKLNWSTKLEVLADALIEQWVELSRKKANPFAKLCIVVSDKASENWLKQYMLLDRKLSRIMMNVEFVMLPEFINDWLAAQVKGLSPRERNAGLHPYSREVLAWRIYRILSNAREGGDLDTLLLYLKKDEKNQARRRYALSARLARLYDDYLNSRFQMLENWENHIVEQGVPSWQPALYRMLAKEDFGSTYANDYMQAFRQDADAGKAMEHGFPKYMGIHVFDTPFMSEPTLRILERISEASQITFWMFTPKADWLADTPSDKEVRSELRKQLQQGKSFDEKRPDFTEKYYDSPEERLLGAMAPGARAVLGALFDDAPEGANAMGDDAECQPFGNLDIEVHRCYSPRREMEAVKDGLLHFFAKGDKKPHDVIVLCGDWETYAPIIETVFNQEPGRDDYIPCTVDKGSSGDTPLTQSFKDLLTFGDKRFEVSSVLALLSVPAIRAKLKLDDKAVDDLMDMVAKANIHWGADDADVARILELDTPRQNTFTWQRGLDRLIAEMLYGFPEDNDLLLDVEDTRIHPVGHVEAERANALAQLWYFIDEIKALINDLSGRKSAYQLRELLLGALERFYDDGPDYQYELSVIRNAINGVYGSIVTAKFEHDELEPKVFVTAVTDAIGSSVPGIKTPADSVLIAPLKSSYATPHEYVWICGLGEGSFPHNEHRSSFDLIGRHPTRFDSSSKDRDAFALLKASLGARKKLCFSFVGKDVHSNESIPSSVLLNELMDYFKSRQIPFTEYSHPLHSYSRRYFQQGTELPDTYSRKSQKIAEALAKVHGISHESEYHAFTLNRGGITEINLSELESFYAEPRKFIFEYRLGIKKPYFSDFNDNEQFDARLSWSHNEMLAFNGIDSAQQERLAELTLETGEAANTRLANAAIEDAAKLHERCFKLGKMPVPIAELYALYQNAQTEEHTIELSVCGGEAVRLKVQYRVVDFLGKLWNIVYAPYNEQQASICSTVRHLAYNVIGGGNVATLCFGLNSKGKIIYTQELGIYENADLLVRERLASLVEFACQGVPDELLDYGAFATGAEFRLENMEETLAGNEIISRYPLKNAGEAQAR